MLRTVPILVLSFAVFICGLGFGSPQESKPGAANVKDIGSTQETGCLTKDLGSFRLNREGGGVVALTGSADLEKHVGHTVRLTGTRMKTNGNEAFRVASITDVEASCGDGDKPTPFSKAAARAGKDAPDRPTADQQGTSAGDQKMTQEIRQAVVADETLSTSAHNVKIITRNGHVTLRGPVRSSSEKEAIESMAKEVAGEDHVKNELIVTPDDSQAKPQPK